jgi:predicted dehydrogenase
MGYVSFYNRDPQNIRKILGTKGRIEIEISFNAPPDQPCRAFIDDGVDLSGRRAEIFEFGTCNQYTIQVDLFSKSIRRGTELPVPLEDSVRNMAVIEALFRSAKSDRWEAPLVRDLEA